MSHGSFYLMGWVATRKTYSLIKADLTALLFPRPAHIQSDEKRQLDRLASGSFFTHPRCTWFYFIRDTSELLTSDPQ